MSAVGLFSASPGVSDGYVLGSPLFKHVSIDRRAKITDATHLEDMVASITADIRRAAAKEGAEHLRTEADRESDLKDYEAGCCLDIVAPAADKDTMLVIEGFARMCLIHL